MLKHSTIDVLKLLGVAALYALLLYIGELFFDGDNIVGHFEPASGLALAALLLGGKRYAWGVLLGAFLIHAISGSSLWEAVTVASGDTLQALCGAWLLTRGDKFDLRLQSLRDYLRLILLGGCASIAISALAVSTVLLVSGLLVPGNYFHSLLQWWMSDTLGVILITPLILVWWGTRNDWREAGKMIEAVLLLGLTILAGQAVFLGGWHDVIGQVAKDYWMFLLATWAAVRLGVRETVVVLVMTAVYALLGAIQGVGFFADDIAQTHLVNYWFYMMILSVVGMALATHFTERRQAEAVLRESQANIKAILDNLPYLSWLKDIDGRYIKVNKVYVDYTGLGDARKIIGKTDFDLWPKELAEKYRADDAGIMAARQQKHVEESSFDGSKEHWVETFKTPIIDESGNVLGIVGFSRDITTRKQAEGQIHKLAFYDALTQLPNRRLLDDRLRHAIAASKRSGLYGALMFLDLDNFKPLNDAYGHDVGDLLLVEVARRIASCVREADTVARFGGDEFVVVLGELKEDKASSSAQAGIVADKIRAILDKPYMLKFQREGKAETIIEYHCTSSIGVALFIDQKASPEDILKWADIAMYRAKEGGRNLVRFFDSES